MKAGWIAAVLLLAPAPVTAGTAVPPEDSPSATAVSADGGAARREAAGALLRQVSDSWQWSEPVADGAAGGGTAEAVRGETLAEKLGRIVVPVFNVSGMEPGAVVALLGALAEEHDDAVNGPRGVNIVLLAPAGPGPAVSLALKRVTLRRLLDFVTAAAGLEYEVLEDAVVVRPGGSKPPLDLRVFPIARPTVLRLTGQAEPREAPPAAAAAATGGAAAPAGEGAAIREFLQLAGIDFAGTPGSSLAFDGSQLIVTQTPRHLERIANLLERYRQARQVEIEAKFMEVQEGALEELGLQWTLATSTAQANAGAQAVYGTAGGVNRSLADAFRNANAAQQISITGPEVPAGGVTLPTSPPAMPGGVLLGAAAGALADVRATVGEFDVQALVRALAQKSGTELLSAPKLTVLSGSPATITVAQEMRYPRAYGEIQSQVGTGSISGGGSAGVSITSGTPQDFATRNVGVELRVRPTVEEDDRSITLELHPRVTEFEGFVEYGGPSIAISGGTTVTVPPGFYQPIFSVREVATQVTLWDGATLVMGGLTREDVKKVHDRVPVLGSIPLVGRLFRSTGESTQKRNLLIFVTANLVTPGGGRQRDAAGK